LRATATTTISVTLAWTNTAGTNVTGFYIERSPNPVTTWVQVGSTAANTLTFRNTGLTTRTTYNYRVRAYNAVGPSGYSNILTVTTR
jgi:titin